MVHVISADNAHRYAEVLEACYRLRHRIFVEKRGWTDIARDDGREIDQFDTAEAVHFAAVGEDGEVLAYARILPTTGPHLLSDVYPWLCQRAEIPRGPHIVEWTRHCVDTDRLSGQAAVQASNELILAVLEWCEARGISHATCQGDPLWITRTLQLGFGVDPLGLPQMVGDELVVALLFEIGERAIKRTRAVCGRRGARRPERAPVTPTLPELALHA